MKDGALGMSSGLFYLPAIAADTAELAPLARIVAAAGGIYTAHIRNEFEGVVDALEEFFSVSDDARLPLVVSHHKCAGVGNWGRSGETLALIDETRRKRPVYMDCYPYAAGSTVLREDLADGEIEVLVNWSEPFPEMAGRKLSAISAEWGCTEAEAAGRLAPGGASYFQMHEHDVRAILKHEACMIGSDGLPNDPLPHPRLWGTFPRMLGHYVRDVELMPLATAVHRMTGLSAATFNLGDRGVVRVGAIADLTVFDPATVADLATYEQPQQVSCGIEHVFVGGVLSWTQGGPTGKRAGRFASRAGREPDA
jgi:N-acyl-D-amino-acid deacylase